MTIIFVDTHGHRWRQDERLDGGVILEAQRCLRCGRFEAAGLRRLDRTLDS